MDGFGLNDRSSINIDVLFDELELPRDLFNKCFYRLEFLVKLAPMPSLKSGISLTFVAVSVLNVSWF